MPGVPEKFKTEKCTGCKTPISEEQFIVSLGFCEACFDSYQDDNLKVAEQPSILNRLAEDLEDAQDEVLRADVNDPFYNPLDESDLGDD